MAKQDHLLIVDDDPQIRQLLCDYLSDAGFQVSTAGDGKEMRRRLALNVIDLIVLDLMLPGEDGLSLCRELRVSSNTPVIMLTAKGTLIDRIVGLEIGADDYLPKPFDPRELLVRIKVVL
ncbi:MAG: response regulator, partial [Pseudomonas sp.]